MEARTKQLLMHHRRNFIATTVTGLWLQVLPRVFLGLVVIGLQMVRARAESDSAPVSEKVSAAASDAQKTVEAAGKEAANKLEILWERIDERRLKNRTPDEIVAWILMGLLVAAILHRLSKLNAVANCALGLAGAFAGGIIAHVTQFNIGLGPVLIRYEDLICAMGGSLVLLVLVRWIMARRKPKVAK